MENGEHRPRQRGEALDKLEPYHSPSVGLAALAAPAPPGARFSRVHGPDPISTIGYEATFSDGARPKRTGGSISTTVGRLKV